MSIGGLLACAERSGTVKRSSSLRESEPKKSIDLLMLQIPPKKKSSHQRLLKIGSRATGGAAGAATRTTKLALSSLRITGGEQPAEASEVATPIPLPSGLPQASNKSKLRTAWITSSHRLCELCQASKIHHLGGLLESCGQVWLNYNSTLPQSHAVASPFFRVKSRLSSSLSSFKLSL